MNSEQQMLQRYIDKHAGYTEGEIRPKDTRSTKGLSEGMESRAPRDLPRRYIRHHEADLQDEFIQL